MTFPLFILLMLMQQSSFKENQLKHSRVKTAYDEKEAVVKRYFSDQKLSYAGFQLFIRGFKKEKQLEVWAKEKGKTNFRLLTTYEFCSTSGSLGPKRKEGDLQIPEGVYQLNHFNPLSNFYLSLGVSYPNSSDRILSDKNQPGGAIYIHGNCVTVGCIPITDEKIKELYVVAVEARNNGQENIPLHIFPSRLTEDELNQLKRFYPDAATIRFWENLKQVFDDFESTKQLKSVKVNSKGEYYL
jgi:murein L,D-transpeptidase YafK